VEKIGKIWCRSGIDAVGDKKGEEKKKQSAQHAG